MKIVTSVLFCAAFLSGCTQQPRSSNPTDDVNLLKAISGPGVTATISAEGSGTPCYDTVDALNAAAEARAQNDTYGLQGALAHAVRLKDGQHVRVTRTIWNFGSSGAVRFRIENGANAGTVCWASGGLPGGVVKNLRF